MVKGKAEVIAQESICRICRQIQADIREGGTRVIFDGPGPIRDIQERMAPAILALVRIRLSCQWN